MPQIRTATLEGRPHLVAPVTMLTTGVHEGSAGAVLYTPAELAASAPHWNSRPVVVYHPDQWGSPSAGHPRIFDGRKVGFVFNTRFDASRNRLVAELWIDPTALERVDSRVLTALNHGMQVEVSTGLWFDSDDIPGSFNGAHFDGTVSNYKPDHLAILPDITGACSIAAGCGLLAA
ncbi:DUF2213 domain-containing protein [Alienimonas chondri]|uniref:Uncharacterized protein n=1 Tax=Alienimonas chondri TaxID=2681879 RepID=A0ABX1VE21_9PLAN|nr:DUF2213 domain-containing protein [Alienimonas chondri]NNJ26145.1 hypothetical protein [Alienimonas chondri]